MLRTASIVTNQNPSPTIPACSPYPITASAMGGNTDLLRLLQITPVLWMVPRTSGWGVQSLIKRLVAGTTPVRAATKDTSTLSNVDHLTAVYKPEFCCAKVSLSRGTSAQNGALKYTKGKRYRAVLQTRTVPHLS